MSDAVSDLFTLPVLVLLISLLVIGFVYITIFLINNAANNDINTQCVRFADAMNTFVSMNSGFSDEGSGSFTDYVVEYLSLRPIQSPCYVQVSVADYNNTFSSTSYSNSSGFWVSPRITEKIDFADDIYSALNKSVPTGSASGLASACVLQAGEDGVLPEGCHYEIEVTPLYRSYNRRSEDEGKSSQPIGENVGDARPGSGLFTYNNNYYVRGSSIKVKGVVTNYTKRLSD